MAVGAQSVVGARREHCGGSMCAAISDLHDTCPVFPAPDCVLKEKSSKYTTVLRSSKSESLENELVPW